MNLYEEVTSYPSFWSLMYPTRVDFCSLEDQLIEIATDGIDWAKDKSCFFYVWGWPGPDYNKYTVENYGKNWAFTKEEILMAWGERWV